MAENDSLVWADDLALALELADLADAISTERYRSADLHVSLKPDRSHVTDADQAVERAIRERVAAARPDDTFYGEEYGHDAPSHRQWVVDPIDGTANFLRGVPVWAALISLVVDGVPVVGVVSAPALGRRWWATQGGGAFSTEHEGPLRVSGVRDLADASLSFNGLEYWIDAGRLPQLLELTSRVWRTRAYGDFWSYMLVAEGALDVAGEFDLQPYDMAAVAVVVEEAGGRFTSADGRPGPWHGTAMATNGLLHETVLGVVAAPPA
ncbi:inositol monophosphatase family protein [Frigoribacterium sp. PhB24]|uniref:inositol monophosphatase family protein n=1 Tax=Frigoribacterium sp. PhB24 TaxID=2485204 RepID=UPI000F47C283|nr:inositol monophosphatase family protein [Frigoribacterium sp. PhB24]ROS54725.1 histidinol-phosphatase [Frigoribacterium sp. PhB24]